MALFSHPLTFRSSVKVRVETAAIAVAQNAQSALEALNERRRHPQDDAKEILSLGNERALTRHL
jgi:hypothetical protein